MLEQQSRYDTAREKGKVRQKKEVRRKRKQKVSVRLLRRADERPPPPVPYTTSTCTPNARTQQLVHTSVFAARWRSCLSAEVVLSDAFLCRLGEE